MKKINIPNALSLVRCLLVPIFVAAIIMMRDIYVWGCVIPAALYGLTAFTDMLDGKIARKYNLVTDFGKFIDPLADKFMVLGSMFALLALAGDVGCALGPSLVSGVSNIFSGNLKSGLTAAVIFPILLIAGIFILKNINVSKEIN